MSVPSAIPPLPEDDLRRLTAMVRDFSGIELPDNRRQSLERVVDRTLRTYELTRPRELIARLSHPGHRLELEAFTAMLTIGETHFFRNTPQLDALRTRVLPELIARRSAERRLRLWSAGSSTGEEAYSLAILIDMLLPRRDGWNITILATDINREALDRAQKGVYGPWSFRQVPEEIKQRYFVRHEREYHLVPAIRDMVTFGYLNLVDDAYPSLISNTQAMDLILCRNVLIYFNEETINRVVSRLDECIVPGGWMLAGHAESPMPIFRERFIARDFPMAVIYQKASGGRTLDVEREKPVTPSAPVVPIDRPRPARAVPMRDVKSLETTPPARLIRPATPEVTALPVRPDANLQSRQGDELAEARALWRQGEIERALTLLQDHADRSPASARSLHLAAKILASLLRLEPAEHTIRLARDREPLWAPIHYLHGLILQELGRTSDALDALRRCVYLEPAFALGHYSLASLLVVNGQEQRAERALATTIELVKARTRDEEVEGGDGVTFGRLLDLAQVQRQLIHPEEPR